MKFFLTLFLIAAGGLAYYVFVYRPAHSFTEVAYALAASVEVVDAPTEVHLVLRNLKQGERVEVRGRTRNWVHVELADGLTGWVEARNMLDRRTYDAGRRLLEECGQLPAQAVGHIGNVVNLRLDPSREGAPIAQLKEKQAVEILGRHLTERLPPSPPSPAPAPEGAGSAAASPAREAWYLVRVGSLAGWVLGRLVDLDVPESIAVYGQGTNLVAWLVLSTVDDNGQQIPQYLIADRVGTQELDFNHIRVLTWGKDRHRYATAYVESNLNGYFPIPVVRLEGVPYFRLRLMEEGGRKFQKIYAFSGTIVRRLGTVEGWETNAMPVRQVPERKGIQAGRPGSPRLQRAIQ